jgi:transposase-like protein
MSRNPHEPNDKTKAEVAALISYGVPVKQVAAYIGIDDKTLSKYYREIMDEAMAKAHGQVGRYLFQGASGALLEKGASHSDCLRAAMFYAKTQMGFKETDRVETTGVDGGPIENKWTIEIVDVKTPTA